jgi:hypothetical protein
MAVIGHLHKIVCGGKLSATETWSMSFHYLRPDDPPLTIAGSLVNAFSEWFARDTSYINKLATIDYVKANELNPLAVANTGGKPPSLPFTRYLDQNAVNEIYFTPGFPASAMAVYGLPQGTQAVSLQTALRRGPAHAGRFYPPTCSPVMIDGRVAAAETALQAGSASQLISDINGSNAGKVVVFSQIGPVTNDVTGVRVGRVVDTQRRRRRNLLEDYQVNDLG